MEKGNISRSPLFQFIYGMALTLFLSGLFASATYFTLFYLKGFNTIAYVIIGAVLLKSSFSLKELRQTALRVKGLLVKDKLAEARYELRSLVSRDTQDMSRSLAVSATVESVAENACDSFVAPLFYFLFLGVPGAIAYRVVNTLDAMIGYHGKYEYLGKFAARLDDLLNLIPARLSALLLVLASFLSGRGKAAWRGAIIEHSKTESPNAGWTMAAMAGALGVQLEKPGHYQLGKADTPLVPETIDASLQLVRLAASLWVIICFVAGGTYFALTT
jgi:adenosylcobinamide-phosphate synthase